MAWLYILILVLAAAGLIGAYRVLGTPSRLAARDYNIVLADVATSVERAAGQLREALDGEALALEDAASASRWRATGGRGRPRPPRAGKSSRPATTRRFGCGRRPVPTTVPPRARGS